MIIFKIDNSWSKKNLTCLFIAGTIHVCVVFRITVTVLRMPSVGGHVVLYHTATPASRQNSGIETLGAKQPRFPSKAAAPLFFIFSLLASQSSSANNSIHSVSLPLTSPPLSSLSPSPSPSLNLLFPSHVIRIIP